MSRLLFLLMLFLVVQSSCTKEQVQVAEEVTLESQLEELRLLQIQVLSSLSPLKSLSSEELQLLATSSDPLGDLTKINTIDLKEFENLSLQLAEKIGKAKALGAKDDELVAFLEKSARVDYLKLLSEKNKSNSAAGTPCYDSWENTVLIAHLNIHIANSF